MMSIYEFVAACDVTDEQPECAWVYDMLREFEHIFILGCPDTNILTWCEQTLGEPAPIYRGDYNIGRMLRHHNELWSFAVFNLDSMFAISKSAPLTAIIEFKLRFC